MDLFAWVFTSITEWYITREDIRNLYMLKGQHLFHVQRGDAYARLNLNQLKEYEFLYNAAERELVNKMLKTCPNFWGIFYKKKPILCSPPRKYWRDYKIFKKILKYNNKKDNKYTKILKKNMLIKRFLYWWDLLLRVYSLSFFRSFRFKELYVVQDPTGGLIWLGKPYFFHQDDPDVYEAYHIYLEKLAHDANNLPIEELLRRMKIWDMYFEEANWDLDKVNMIEVHLIYRELSLIKKKNEEASWLEQEENKKKL